MSSAGTKDPICAITMRTPTCFSNTDFPLAFGPFVVTFVTKIQHTRQCVKFWGLRLCIEEEERLLTVMI